MPHLAAALDYPTRPVRIIAGFPAGSSTDITARIVGQWLSERLGQQFIVENRPGAGTNIATEAIAHAPSDGYSILWITQTNAINATLYGTLNFNFIRDIQPIASVVRVPAVIVANPSFPAKTVPELIAYAKSNPGKINYASPGIGSLPHVAGELFKFMTSVDVVQVAYRDNYVPDLLSGQVQTGFPTLPFVLEHIKTGKLRALAVTTAMRQEVLPDVPTVAEFVPGYEAAAWFGIGAPKNTPAEILNKLNSEVNAGLADAKIKERLANLSEAPMVMSPSEFSKLIADETEKWGKVIRAANIKAQ
jgi:tripartite-type tricarboxylate transporter receptor subunit TctC